MTHTIPLLKTCALLASCATLLACGGGGGGSATTTTDVSTPSTPGTTTSAKLSDAQGFWSAGLGGSNSATAVILPNGQAWVVYQSANTVTALAQAALSLNGATYTSVGKHYGLPGGAVQDYSFTGNLTGSNTGTLVNTITVGTGSATAVTWTYNKTYETPATQASVQGRWSGAQGADVLTWDVDANGALAGTSTTGCTYSGTLKPNANPVAVLDVAVTELCAGVSKALSGIATVNAAKSGMSVAYTTAAGAQAGVLVLAK